MIRRKRDTAEAGLLLKQASWGQGEKPWHCHHSWTMVEGYL